MPNDRIVDLVNDLLNLWDPVKGRFHAFDNQENEEIAIILSELEKLTTNMQYEEVEIETTQEEIINEDN